jgi:hypothetical protein
MEQKDVGTMEGRTPVSPPRCALIDKEMKNVRHNFLLKKQRLDGW